MEQQHPTSETSQQQAQRISDLLTEAERECRRDSNDPAAQALFAMLAEILGGAMKALRDYQSQAQGIEAQPQERERQLAIDIDQIEPSSKASIAVPYD